MSRMTRRTCASALMNTMELVRFVEHAHPRRQAPRPAAPLFYAKLVGPVQQSILRGRQLLLSVQKQDGSWFGAKIGDQAVSRHRRSRYLDTLLATQSLRASGLPANHGALIAAVTWLLRARRCNSSLDVTELASALGALRIAETNAAFQNPLPPVLEVIHERIERRHSAANTNTFLKRLRPLIVAIVETLVRNQNGDGGWGTTDVTGVVLEAIAFADCGYAKPAVERAINYLCAKQRADGSWPTGTIAQPIRATSAALRGLLAAGVPSDEDAIADGLDWLAARQQANGAWAEPAFTSHAEFANATYDERFADCSETSHTAWALLAFAAAGQANHAAALRAVDFLIHAQNDLGGWDEPRFPHHVGAADRWLCNDLHTVACSLMALSRWAVAATSAQSASTDAISLRLVGALADN